jgi:hypothetical protein
MNKMKHIQFRADSSLSHCLTSYKLPVVHALTGNLAETNLNPAVQISAQFTQDHIRHSNYLPILLSKYQLSLHNKITSSRVTTCHPAVQISAQFTQQDHIRHSTYLPILLSKYQLSLHNKITSDTVSTCPSCCPNISSVYTTRSHPTQ